MMITFWGTYVHSSQDRESGIHPVNTLLDLEAKLHVRMKFRNSDQVLIAS